ncbi:thymidine kinase [Spiroplasma sp. TIUS-1]|uniref:thymidine kinase n=1 Tax=Spiroplasma sp. TIUS-1 TaxID=216963 RepID=UPI001398681F|nr:thymidine kinase [Spiroplasma sp. TIUS-1]QHX36210.1 thymidine kinase [Spiroplasma sp. TIUS-1]
MGSGPERMNKMGWIELIVGCMFAGKTEEFIRRLIRYKFGKKRIIVFKPEIDKRYSEDNVQTHHGIRHEANPVKDSKALLKLLKNKEFELDANKKFDVIGIDEIQFFDKGIVKVVEDLANEGYIIVANGLDKDYKSDPFKNVFELLPLAEYVEKLSALCSQCGGHANRTQRLVKGLPVRDTDGPLVLISGEDSYEARCRHCYVKPNVNKKRKTK